MQLKNKIMTGNRYILELPFKILYLIFAFFTYFNLTYARPIMSLVVDLILLSGTIIIILRLTQSKNYIKTKGLIFLILFLISYIISMAFNVKYGISDNFKYLIWTGFHFFVFYVCDTKRETKDYMYEFNILTWVFICFIFILSLVSIMMYYMGISIEEYGSQGVRLAGLVWGRLWGTFTDPNYGSVFAVIGIIFSIYKIRTSDKLVIKIFLIINIIVQLMYIAFSDSRTGLVCVFACSFVYILFMLLKFFQFKKLKILKVISLTIIISAINVLIPIGIKNINNEIQMSRANHENSENIEENQMLNIGREEDLKNNFSNRRFELWYSALEIVETEPLIGVSFFNLVPYAKNNIPNTYLINNDHGVFGNFHNMLFNILVGQGLLGLVIVMGTAFYFGYYILKNIFNVPKENFEYIVIMLTTIVAACVSSMFLTDIYYVNSPTSMLFWLFLGYIMHYIGRMNGEKENG